MGVTVQWRGENEREPGRYGKTITFGNLRDKATGYMSYSDRVGPGIVVLGGSRDICDRLMNEGFTALAPELPSEPDKAHRVLHAAIDHLVDNWHPRIGVLAFGERRSFTENLERPIDAVVVFDDESEVDADVIDDFRYDLS